MESQFKIHYSTEPAFLLRETLTKLTVDFIRTGCLVKIHANQADCFRASDFFLDSWAEVTHGAKNSGSFSEMMSPSVSN